MGMATTVPPLNVARADGAVRAYIIYAGVRMVIFVQSEPTTRSLYAKKTEHYCVETIFT